MTSETERWIRWHAGLEAAGNNPPGFSSMPIIDALETASVEALAEAVSDLIAAFSQLNIELNGPTPSTPAAGATELPRGLVYAVAEIERLVRGSRSRSSEMAASDIVRAAWMIEIAWLAVLAGDIDDLREHLREQARADRQRG